MTKTFEAMCNQCGTLASPTCECGALATSHTTIGLNIYSNNLNNVSLTNVWKDLEGRIIWLEQTDLLSKARVSTVFDIHFTKE